jgi:hypothetical protein
MDESVIGFGETNKALTGKLDLEGGVDGEGDGGGESKDVEPVSGGRRHAVAGEEGAAKAEGEEEQEDDFGRMHVEGVLPGGGDVDHVVEGGKEELGGVGVASGGGCGGDGLTPHLTLKALAFGRDLLADRVEEMEARGGVVVEKLAECRLRLLGEKIEAEVGGADVVGLLNDKLPMRIVAVDGAGEGKGQQKSEEGKDCAFDGVALDRAFAAEASAPAQIQKEEHRGEEEKGESRWEDHGLGDDDSKLVQLIEKAKRKMSQCDRESPLL